MRIEELIRKALDEDLGQGDITTESTIPADLEGVGVLRSKQELVVCGHEVAQEVFRQMGADYVPLIKEGTLVEPFTEIAEVRGKIRALLTGERLALNFLMKLSGIATHTHRVLGSLP